MEVHVEINFYKQRSVSDIISLNYLVILLLLLKDLYALTFNRDEQANRLSIMIKSYNQVFLGVILDIGIEKFYEIDKT